MEILQYLLNFILHLDQHMVNVVTQYGVCTYAILFLVIFCETAFVVTPFLPGDSLLFAAGALAAHSADALNVHFLFFSLVIASIFGNTTNYMIGKYLGPKVFHSNDSLLLNRKYLLKAHAFYQQYGGKTIIIARFIPIIRTFAPFVAGIADMSYKQFTVYNVAGAVLWIGGLIYTSYLFGNLPFVKEHFSVIILAIIGISLLPPLVEALRQTYIRATNNA
jgi:membrane-associated protein